MLSSEWIQSIPLRILRLSANATATEIHKAAASMRRAAKLRAVELNADDVPSFGAGIRHPAMLESLVKEGKSDGEATCVFVAGQVVRE